ncbi:MAG: DUF1385 domain-containing protein [Chloroflexota bacterium]
MSDTKALSQRQQTSFNYGGQAVIEGVMMRGSKALAVAVRNPAGDIVVHTEPLDARIYGGRMARMPFVRGLTLLWDALGLGIKSLMFSADVALEEEDGKKADGEKPSSAFDGPAQIGTVVVSLSFSIFLFFVIPAFVAGVVDGWFQLGSSQIVSNLIEGVVRLALLVGYIWGISFIPDIKRLYGYHGAEHKTINAYEDNAQLTPENVARYSLEHPRCGTAFLLTVVIISILLYTLLPPMSLGVRILSRILLLPVIAGMGYEFLRFTAAHQDNAFIRFITKPNLALQRLTTREPDRGMLEVAIAALDHVLAYENGQQQVVDTVMLVEASAGNAAS